MTVEPKPVSEPPRVERWAVRIDEANREEYGGLVEVGGFVSVADETRKQAERRIADLPKTLTGELLHLVELREGERVLTAEEAAWFNRQVEQLSAPNTASHTTPMGERPEKEQFEQAVGRFESAVISRTRYDRTGYAEQHIGAEAAARQACQALVKLFREQQEIIDRLRDIALPKAIEMVDAALAAPPPTDRDGAAADSRRLDWVQEQIYEGKPLPEFVPAEFADHYCVAPSGFQYGSTGGANLREAIDAAMQAASPVLPTPSGRAAEAEGKCQ